MKLQLSILASLVSLLSYSQTAIDSYYSVPMSEFSVVTSTPAIDESTAGANLTWTFDQLSETGTSSDTYTSPTGAQLSSYPGTTSVLTISSTVGSTTSESEIFTKDEANAVSITAIKTTDLELNYSIDNGFIGTFPLNYGYTNTDDIAGTYEYTTFSGTFSGTITTSVDAYGTLTMNDLGSGGYSGSVTRLKTVQDISLTYIIPNAGTATQTNYYYYDNDSGDLVFRTTTVTLVVPALSINDTSTVMESLQNGSLSVQENERIPNRLLIETNPVGDFLNMRLQDTSIVNSIEISDMSGKQVLKAKKMHRSIAVDYLDKGIYFVPINTSKGIFSSKFIKD